MPMIRHLFPATGNFCNRFLFDWVTNQFNGRLDLKSSGFIKWEWEMLDVVHQSLLMDKLYWNPDNYNNYNLDSYVICLRLTNQGQWKVIEYEHSTELRKWLCHDDLEKWLKCLPELNHTGLPQINRKYRWSRILKALINVLTEKDSCNRVGI